MRAGKIETCSEAQSYMKNLSPKEQASADAVLAAIFQPEEMGSATSTQVTEWQLPFHSVILSAISKPFAASSLYASKTMEEKTLDGKRIVRLPLNKSAGKKLLQFSYGVLNEAENLSLADAVQLAAISNMQDLPGMSTPSGQIHIICFWSSDIHISSGLQCGNLNNLAMC